MGTVGDPAGAATSTSIQSRSSRARLPKLFGLIDLTDVTMMVDSDLPRMPQVISEFMGRIEGLDQGDGPREHARSPMRSPKPTRCWPAPRCSDPAVRAQWKKQAEDAIDAANLAQDAFEASTTSSMISSSLIRNQGDSTAAVKAMRDQFLQSIDAAVKASRSSRTACRLSWPSCCARSRGRSSPSWPKSRRSPAISHNTRRGLAESGSLARVRFEWKPKLESWPAAEPLIELKEDSLLLAIQARAGFDGKGSAHALADLRDFTLHLFPKAELISLKFARFSFMVEGNKKPEIDIVFERHRLPRRVVVRRRHQEADPARRFLRSAEHAGHAGRACIAGFSVDLPNIALGMFSITNLSLGADVQVPFLGKAVTVGFNFCTREKPFTIAVAFLGGGGWCGIRCSAHGLEVLEVGLEAGACIAVNFGVASGSVSAMLGVYIRIESRRGFASAATSACAAKWTCSGLVSACIELYMELKYQYDTGKLIGQASITVNV